MSVVDIHEFPTALLPKMPENFIFRVLQAKKTIQVTLIESISNKTQSFATFDSPIQMQDNMSKL